MTSEKTHLSLVIESLGAGGYGVGRSGGKVVFVPFTAPEDRVVCEIIEDKGSFAFGRLLEVTSPSPRRIAPPCPVFGRCGGCQWQHIPYEDQIAAKGRLLVDALERIGRIDAPPVSATLPAPEQYGWRARVDLAFGQNAQDEIRVGFYSLRNSEIIDVANCPVATGPINKRIALLPEALSMLDIREGTIELVAGMSGMVSAHLATRKMEHIGRRKAERFMEVCDLAGMELTIGGRKTAFGSPIVSYPGWDGGHEVGLLCRPSGFAQANPAMNRKVIDVLLSYPFSGKRVLELFCGIGNLTLPMATARAGVTGVELDRESVRLAKETLTKAGFRDVALIDGRAEEVVAEEDPSRTRYDVVVLDPPRTGARGVMERIADLAPDDIIYLSCSPPTLARDMKVLSERGWGLVSATPFDMFPQTFHVEALCRIRHT